MPFKFPSILRMPGEPEAAYSLLVFWIRSGWAVVLDEGYPRRVPRIRWPRAVLHGAPNQTVFQTWVTVFQWEMRADLFDRDCVSALGAASLEGFQTAQKNIANALDMLSAGLPKLVEKALQRHEEESMALTLAEALNLVEKMARITSTYAPKLAPDSMPLLESPDDARLRQWVDGEGTSTPPDPSTGPLAEPPPAYVADASWEPVGPSQEPGEGCDGGEGVEPPLPDYATEGGQ